MTREEICEMVEELRNGQPQKDMLELYKKAKDLYDLAERTVVEEAAKESAAQQADRKGIPGNEVV